MPNLASTPTYLQPKRGKHPEDLQLKLREGLLPTEWDRIAAFILLDDKVSLGFPKSLNKKVRVVRRRTYAVRDKEYLRLKVLTCMLPAL
jgi:hypothetical protein